MPPEHMNLLRYLMKLFLKMQDEVDTNLMDAENLAKEMGAYFNNFSLSVVMLNTPSPHYIQDPICCGRIVPPWLLQ